MKKLKVLVYMFAFVLVACNSLAITQEISAEEEIVEGTWEEIASMPTHRSLFGVGVVDDKIYAIGGVWGETLGVNELYDPETNTWTTKASMPSLGRSYFGCIGVNGLVYAIGGGSSGLVPYNSVYDPESNGWATKQSMPSARLYFGIATWEGKIYCIGGQYGPVGTNEVYDVATDTWTTLAAMPTPRSYLCASAVDGKIYLIGGSTTDFGRPSNLNEVYDITTDTWSTMMPMLKGVHTYASAVLNDKIYIIGGVSPNEENILQIYDCKTNNWSYGASLPITLSGAAAVATTGYHAPERIYVFGGYFTGSNQPSNYNWVYDPANDSWTSGKVMPTNRRDLGVANVDDQLYAIGGDEGRVDFSRVNERYTPFGYSEVPLKTTPSPTGDEQPTLPTAAILAGAVVAATIVVVAGVVVYHFKHAPAKPT